jgi:hypothetical protein
MKDSLIIISNDNEERAPTAENRMVRAVSVLDFITTKEGGDSYYEVGNYRYSFVFTLHYFSLKAMGNGSE